MAESLALQLQPAQTIVVSLQDFDSICRFCLQSDVLLTEIFNGRRRESETAAAAAAAADDCDWSRMIDELTGMKVRIFASVFHDCL